jgi:hypothetical protein
MHDDELDTFKRINLLEYAIERGFRRLPRESSRSCHVLADDASRRKFLVTREPDGQWLYFNLRDPAERGSIIEFVQSLTRYEKIDRVAVDLRQWLEIPQDVPRLPAGPPSLRDHRAVVEAFARARAVRNSTSLNARGIRPETIRSRRFRGTWRVESRGKVLFPHRDDEGLCGFEAEGQVAAGFSSSGSKTVWESARRSSDNILLITKSAIDALSYAQLHQTEHVWYWSTAGTVGAEQAAVLDRRLGDLPVSTEIVAAVDADLGGRTLAAALSVLAGKRGLSFAVTTPPPALGRTWNDALCRHEAEHVASIQARRTGTERSR